MCLNQIAYHYLVRLSLISSDSLDLISSGFVSSIEAQVVYLSLKV